MGVSFESRNRTIIADELLSYLIELTGSYTGLDYFGNLRQSSPNKEVTLAK
jgi:hypothetical protein